MIDNKVRQWPVLGAKEPTLTRSPRPENSDLNAQLQDQTFSEFTGRGERVNVGSFAPKTGHCLTLLSITLSLLHPIHSVRSSGQP